MGHLVGPAAVPAHRRQATAGGGLAKTGPVTSSSPLSVELRSRPVQNSSWASAGPQLLRAPRVAGGEPGGRVEEGGGPEDGPCRRRAGTHDVRVGRVRS